MKEDNQTQWRDMDSAPRDGSKVLLYIPTLDEIFAARFENGLWQTAVWSNRVNTEPAQWMPLPPPPAQQDRSLS